MSTSTDIPELKRIQFFPGQRLTAQDMADLQDNNRELRWLHNRSLHGWGIGTGFGVTGERGDTSVTVAPGYAIDCMGREIILTHPITLTVPAVAANSDGTPASFLLTATYVDDSGQSTEQQRPGVCLPGGTVRLTEDPLIQWQQLSDVQDGMNIILAQASILNCQLNSALSLDVRRSARPSQQPFISSGQTVLESTVWITFFDGGKVAGVTTSVDTSAAGFQATPTYFAHVMGSRLVGGGPAPSPVFALPVITNPTPSSFQSDVYVIDVLSGQLTTVSNPPWIVVWMGIEG